MTEPHRARFSVDERRAQLLELGLRLFAERAYDEVSIDDIASAANISKGLLYHYYGGKRAFYVACVAHAAEALVERTHMSDEIPEPDRARAGLDAYFDYAEEHATAYVALMRSGIGNDPEVAAIVEATRTRIVRRALDGMGITTPRPAFRAALRAWIGAVEAACLEHLEHRDVARVGLVDMLLAGLYGLLVVAKQLDPDAPFALGPPPQPPTQTETASPPSRGSRRRQP
ncbi:MAG: TetR/AcrR family transcriptional regulator [Sandaracinaceae bacterium]|nr:TetR/AcrR family transcriptional regulator [Sandaracinaceae bacterium]